MGTFQRKYLTSESQDSTANTLLHMAWLKSITYNVFAETNEIVLLCIFFLK
jgi:hypothetical protein